MQKTGKNRKFIIDFFSAINGKNKTRLLLSAYTSDIRLISHIEFFENLFPRFKIVLDEITSEENRVVVLGRHKGKQGLTSENYPFSDKWIEIPFAIGFHIDNNKIIDHWFISDQMVLLKQLGLIKTQLK